jgi:hypothetical protein
VHRRVRSFAVLAVVAAAAFAAPGAARAVEVECGQVLTRDTVVSNDLTCDGPGLIAGADGILIDLRGHRIVRTPDDLCPGCGEDSGVDTNGFVEVRVRGGEIRRFSCGVQLRGSSSTVSRLVLRRNGTGVCVEGARHRVLSTTVQGGFFGVAGFGQRGTTIDRLTTESTGAAVDLFDPDGLGGGVTVTRSRLVGSISVEPAQRTRIVGNVLHGAAFSGGIYVGRGDDSTQVARNRITDVEAGILVSNSAAGGVRVVGNRVVGARSWGIASQFFGFDDPYGDGGGDLLDGNTVLDSGVGIRLQGVNGAVVRDNVLGGARQGNGAGLVIEFGTSDALVAGNRVTHSDGDGVRVGVITANVLLRGNVATRNGGDGFDVRSASAVLRGNRSLRNDRWGILAVDGVGGTGNVATGNRAGQCAPPGLC